MAHVVVRLRLHENMSSTTIQHQAKGLLAVLRRRAYYSYGSEGASCNQSSSSTRCHSKFIQTSDKINFFPVTIVTYSIEGMPSFSR